MIRRIKLLLVFFLSSALYEPGLSSEETAPSPVVLPLETPSDQLTQSYQAAFFKMILFTVGLVLLVFITIWLMRRLGRGRFRGLGSHKSISILEKKPLSSKSMLYLIKVEGQKVLIAESQLEVRRLTTIETPTESSSEEPT